MNERPLRTEPANAGEAGGASANAPLTTPEIDASCRWPLLLLFVSALFWLVLSGVFALISAIKLHVPGFLSDCPYLTFGRVRPAQMNMLLYGFATQAAIGVALWLMSRLGRTALALSGLAFVSAVFWNAGVTLGIGGILVGDSTGLAGLEIPRYASRMLLLSYLGLG